MKKLVIVISVIVFTLFSAAVALAWEHRAMGTGTTHASACNMASALAVSNCHAAYQEADMGSCECDQTRPNWWECTLPFDCVRR